MGSSSSAARVSRGVFEIGDRLEQRRHVEGHSAVSIDQTRGMGEVENREGVIGPLRHRNDVGPDRLPDRRPSGPRRCSGRPPAMPRHRGATGVPSQARLQAPCEGLQFGTRRRRQRTLDRRAARRDGDPVDESILPDVEGREVEAEGGSPLREPDGPEEAGVLPLVAAEAGGDELEISLGMRPPTGRRGHLPPGLLRGAPN